MDKMCNMKILDSQEQMTGIHQKFIQELDMVCTKNNIKKHWQDLYDSNPIDLAIVIKTISNFYKEHPFSNTEIVHMADILLHCIDCLRIHGSGPCDCK